MKSIHYIACAVFLLMALTTGRIIADETHTVTISAIDNVIHKIAAEVVLAMYNRVGIHANIKYVPARRSLELANTGETDGDMARILGTEAVYTHLIRIPVPVVYIEGVVFTKRIRKDIRSWKDLKGLKIGIIQGIRYSEIGTASMNPHQARSIGHLIKLLDHDRIDVAVVDKEVGENEINRHYKNSGMYIIGQPLYSAPLYHFIHKKHTVLAPKLEATLKSMMEEGIIDDLWEKARRELLQGPALPDASNP